MHSFEEAHLQATHKIFQYLKSTLDKRILFKKNKELSLEAYTNTN